ncbi:DUF551 domain-containing protein [Raoultella terrigena]|nr:DUF551 domain-containing protein [Raoultella terrigena]MEB7601377.1 DUF551 domain-containing protein [Raoultella terrigena]
MTKLTITREESIQAVFDLKAGYTLGLADVEILKRVARIALAAMDSEPSRNPVLAYADSYRDMAKQGVESVPIWSVITDLERNIAPLYRQAQPAPVVNEDLYILANHIASSKSGLPDEWLDWAEELETDIRRAAMLQAVNSPAHSGLRPEQSNGSPAQDGSSPEQNTIDHGYRPECECSGCKTTARICAELAGNSPVIPDGYVMVPMRLTAENGAKAALIGEFNLEYTLTCHECFGEGCYDCSGEGAWINTIPIDWTTIKEIWAKGVEHFAAAPQLPGSEPAAVPGAWIPVSERMPGSQEWVIVFAKWANQQVLCWDDVQNRWTDFEDQSYYADMFSHWMPLSAAPQEVKGEHRIRDEMDMGARITSHRFKV